MSLAHQDQQNDLAWLWIIGIGDDGVAGLSDDAKRLIQAADVLVGGERHLGFIEDLPKQERVLWPSPWSDLHDLLQNKRDQGQSVCILASGDPFWFGAGSLVAKHFDRSEWICIPHVSAFQLAAQHLGWSFQDCTTLSLHGRPTDTIKAQLGKGGRVLALAEAKTAAELREILDACGFDSVAIQALEHLGGTKHKAFEYEVECGGQGLTADLVTLAFDLGPSRLVPPLSGLPDTVFQHDGQITKQEVRAVSLAKLAPKAGECLWDLGAGSGSISIEWCRLAPSAKAIAFERDITRAERIKANAINLAAYNIEVRVQSVDEPIESFAPDAVFIGGGLSADLLERFWQALAPGGRLVANAVTLESENLLTKFPETKGLSPNECLCRIAVERPITVGNKSGWKPMMTVTQLAVTKP